MFSMDTLGESSPIRWDAHGNPCVAVVEMLIAIPSIIVLRKTAVKLPWLMRAEALWNIGRATSTLKLSFILVFETLVGFYDFYLCHMPIPPKMGRFRYKDRGYDSTIDGGVPVG